MLRFPLRSIFRAVLRSPIASRRRAAPPAATGNLLVDGNPILVDTFPIVFS